MGTGFFQHTAENSEWCVCDKGDPTGNEVAKASISFPVLNSFANCLRNQ